MLKKLFIGFFFALILSLFLPPFSQTVLASSLNWQLVYDSIPEATAIRSSKLKPGLIYASLRKKNNDFDLLKSIDYGDTWVSVKSGLPPGGDINWISTHPNNSQFVAISLWGAGFYASYDEGSTWVALRTFSEPRLVEPDPVDPDNKVYVGGTNGFGLHRLTRSGGTWVDQQILSGGNTAQIIIDSQNPNHIFADVGSSFYRSWNSGNSWTLLSIDQANSAGGLANGNTIYTGRSGTNQGVYKSTDDGTTWTWKNNGGLTGMIYNFSFDQSSGSIFVTRAHNQGGGLWRSINGGDNWENVSSPLWGTKNTWGTEVAGNYIFVSVQDLGIYRAPLTPSSPNPIVLLPGFGGSWSHKGLVENQPTVAGDWTILPFADAYYQPFLTTLKNAGLTDSGANQNLFTFAYDYRKSITDTAVVLNTYLDDVLAKNPGKKANLVAHSMGSLVARQCFEKVTGCAGKIEKIITAGGPHQGTIKAYQLWEGGEIDVSDLVTKAAIELALHVTNLPYLKDKDIIQNRFLGVKDLLPVFDFISGRPYAAMSSLGKNPNLENLIPLSSNFNSAVYPLSGNTIQTNYTLTAIPLTALDSALGLWPDGKPGTFTTAVGDGTILKTSSEISGNTNNKYYSFWHNDYLRDTTSVADILNILGLSPTPLSPPTSLPTSFLSFIIHSPATISVKDQAGNPVGTNVNGQAVFISNPTFQTYQITLTGTGAGPISVDSFYTDSTGTTKDTFNGTVTTGATQTVNYQNYDFASSLASFRAKVAVTNFRGLAPIEATVVTAVNNIQNNKSRAGAFLNLENSLLNIWKLVVTENNGQTRQNLSETAEQLQSLLVSLNSQYRTEPSTTSVTAEITRAQKAVNTKSTKSSLTTREAANLISAKTKLSEAQTFLTAAKNYSATLSSRAAIILSQ